MNRDLANGICRVLEGAEHSDPWGGGHDCWKVGGKIFALIGTSGSTISVKTASVETAEMLIDTGVAERARYLHRSWVALPLDCAPDEMSHRIQSSYALVRAKLPRKTQAALASKGG
ncbi:MmcQ/YjbR family DNA-binding protein [Paracoccus sp. (in: a-proteobacteria)]|uniref:MmcQ/YjbR family DNA-binding protein n=1 Tax=Paracoccus sp. TaxID=267 RepID=UPI00289F22C5|nr:MmcQ/YjbR family DNA-binding protein [Paracoccus sp. (in: a-proteobacteria)]